MSELRNNSIAERSNVPDSSSGASSNLSTPSSINSALGNFIAKRFESFLTGVVDGQLAITWPGGNTTYHGTRSDLVDYNVSVTLHSLQPIRQLAIYGDVGFAESYLRGEWSTDNLLNLFHLFMRSEPEKNANLARSFRNLLSRLKHWRNRNSKAGSQRNIAFHYDLGNDFYKLWLDESMTYSSALFETESDTLAEAQQNKMAKVCTMLQPNAGNRVLEIGCGWGALASYMARNSSVDVEGISLSSEQLIFAKKHNTEEKNQSIGSTLFRHQDYRDVNDKYDHIVSVEMFEAVGQQYWESYFTRLKQLLNADGTAVIQVITIDESRFEKYTKKPDFIQRYIFPGGMLPTRTHLAKLAENAGFAIDQSHWFGKSYAKTLSDWRRKFEAAHAEITSQGFDDRFIRMWRYYLVYCETAFNLGRTDVGLIKLVKKP